MNCTYHIQKQVSFICIAPHKCQCQRKLCTECLYEHGVDVKQAVPIDRFGEMIIKKLKESKIDEKSELINSRMNFKSTISKMDIMMKKLWADLAESIKQIYDLIEQENMKFINLINQNLNPAESSYNDLEKLVQILEGNTLDLWNTQKDLQLIKLEKIKNWLVQKVQAFNEKIKKEVNQFYLMGQSQFLSNFVQEEKLLIKSKIKDEDQFQSQKEHKLLQSLLNQQKSQQFQQQNQIKPSLQLIPKPSTYQIIQHYSIKQSESCAAVAINKDCSIVAAGCEKQIKIYQFKQGIMKLIKVLNEHKTLVVILNFMKQSNQLISGDQGSILIWLYANNSWICSQIIEGHSQWVRCIIFNNNEDLFISSSDDKTIKFWVKQNQWICQQTISDHSNCVHQLSLNESQNQVISCGDDNQILIIEQSELNKNWIVKQKIQVECSGYRLCSIKDNLFTFQPGSGNLMYIYETNSVTKYFTKSKNITVNQGYDYGVLFPQQFNKYKQLLVNKHDKYVNLIKFTENGEFKVEQSIQFGNNNIFGQLSDDGEYLITWDKTSQELQIRRCREK